MNLERSTLERKDRVELATIAEALGKKPPSRAKKSDIVDLILTLAGVGETAAPSSASGAPAEAAPQQQTLVAEPPATESAKGQRSSSRNGGKARQPSTLAASESEAAASPATDPSLADSSVTDPTATGSPSIEADSTTADSTTADANTDASSTGGEPAPATSDGAAGVATSETSEGSSTDSAGEDGSGPGPRGRQGGQSQGGQGQGGQSQGGQSQGGQGQNGQGGQNQEGEGGNRNRNRRRRRGRDRGEGEGGQGQGQNQGQGQYQGGNQPEWDGEPVAVSGLLDLRDDGYGFLRVKGFLPSRDDVYVSVKQCRQLGLRKGDHITGGARPAGHKEKNPAMLKVDTVNGMDPEQARRRPRFEDLTPLFPDNKLSLENAEDPGNMTARIIDLIAPIGKGQRGLIVSPPKAGKTTIMKTIAHSIERNNPEVHLIVLLIDERPEEVTDFRRSINSGEVVASTFDRPADEHTMVAELTIEHAKRMVEYGQDVVIILDGITRLARAYNLAAPATGRIMSGGIDTGALYPPKKFFGAARNIEEGGSLTILATALIETGSTMDNVIFEEFKGTGNMELRLDRRAAEKRVYPAIDVDASSTRHEELLFERSQLNQVWKLRRVLSGLAAEGNATGSLELLIDRMRTFKSNDSFLAEIAKAPSGPTS
jgi:transcription termination factor Rho